MRIECMCCAPIHRPVAAVAAAAAAADAAAGLNYHHYHDCTSPPNRADCRQGKLVVCAFIPSSLRLLLAPCIKQIGNGFSGHRTVGDRSVN